MSRHKHNDRCGCLSHNSGHTNPRTRLQQDPTRTLTIRNRFSAQMRRRFSQLAALIWQSIVTNNALGLPTGEDRPDLVGLNQALPEGAFAFVRDPEKLEGFMTWLQQNIGTVILASGAEPLAVDLGAAPWTNSFVDTAFRRGVRQGTTSLRQQGVAIPEAVADPFRVSRVPQVQGSFLAPVQTSRLAAIQQRVFEDLENITADMADDIRRDLQIGLANGDSARQVATQLVNTIQKEEGLVLRDEDGNIRMRARNRAMILARTEIIAAHHVGNISTFREFGIQGVFIEVEWGTAQDDRVCPECAFMEGRIFTLDEIEFLIPLHPECRCRALPLVEGQALRRPRNIRQRAAVVGQVAVRADGTAVRRGLFEQRTGRRLSGAPAPGVSFRARTPAQQEAALARRSAGFDPLNTSPRTQVERDLAIEARSARIERLETAGVTN